MQPREERDELMGTEDLLMPVYAALRRLLECPALNLDDLEEEDEAAKQQAFDALPAGVYDNADGVDEGNRITDGLTDCGCNPYTEDSCGPDCIAEADDITRRKAQAAYCEAHPDFARRVGYAPTHGMDEDNRLPAFRTCLQCGRVWEAKDVDGDIRCRECNGKLEKQATRGPHGD
jgi:hypothetical protein